MTDLIALAKQAGSVTYTNRHYPDRTFASFTPEILQVFADLIRQDEREAIAQFFEAHWRDAWKDLDIAYAIRARTTT